MAKWIYVCLCVLLLPAAGIAQVTVSQGSSPGVDRSIFGMGLSAGLGSGFGLSFRHHLPGRFSYQVVGGVIKAGSKLHYNVGGELQFDLIRNESTRFHAAGAAGYFFSGENETNDVAGPVREGLGIGVERGSERGLNFGAELLFTFFSDGTILPLPQVSMHYYFL